MSRSTPCAPPAAAQPATARGCRSCRVVKIRWEAAKRVLVLERAAPLLHIAYCHMAPVGQPGGTARPRRLPAHAAPLLPRHPRRRRRLRAPPAQQVPQLAQPLGAAKVGFVPAGIAAALLHAGGVVADGRLRVCVCVCVLACVCVCMCVCACVYVGGGRHLGGWV